MLNYSEMAILDADFVMRKLNYSQLCFIWTHWSRQISFELREEMGLSKLSQERCFGGCALFRSLK